MCNTDTYHTGMIGFCNANVVLRVLLIIRFGVLVKNSEIYPK